MPASPVLQVRNALTQAGWAQGKAHFLAILLVRGEASTSEMAQETGTTGEHVRRIFHQLNVEGIVESRDEQRKALGRPTKVYRLRNPKSLMTDLVAEAERTVKVLKDLKPATPKRSP